MQWDMLGTTPVCLDEPSGLNFSGTADDLEYERVAHLGKDIGLLYHIIHMPTQAVYFGAGLQTPKHAYAHWKFRLRAVDTRDLSIAFKAVYTKRHDFYFRIHGALVLRSGDDYDALRKECKRQQKVWAQTGAHAVLNCDRSDKTRRHWVSIIPRSELAWRLGMKTSEPKKVTLDQSKRAVAERVQSTLASGRPATMHNPTDKPAAPMPAFLRHVLGRDDQGDGEA